MDLCSPPPEKEKPLARTAPNIATENLVNPGKKMRRPVPMTEEERNKIKELKEQHRQIAFQRHDAAYIKHQRDLGLKLGDKLPEELKKIGPPMGSALVMWAEMGRAMNIGMDNFIAECNNPEVYRRRRMSLGLIRDEKGAVQDSAGPQE
ncbi:hypothetical protein ZWY2020_013276 [Hordeum vulgare]|nr:hypothetical protein ZWY2020_013276 [Hordeum vulgare]